MRGTLVTMRLPLYVRVLIGLVAGALIGIVFGRDDIVFGLTTEHLGQLGMLVIRVLKMLAVPLVLFAVLDALVHSQVTLRMGGRLIVICMVNVAVAFTIGLTLMNTIEPGDAWRGHLAEITGMSGLSTPRAAPADATLSPLATIEKWIPESAVQPFADNNVIAVVLLAILIGAAIRRVHTNPAHRETISTVTRVISACQLIVMQMLAWVIEIVPFSVFCVVAHVVGKAGLGVFSALGGFLGVILLGFTLHALGYYVIVAWLVGGKPPRVYLGRGIDAIVTGLSTNSSLATVPVTLKCLDRMDVAPESSRLAALIGTNLNNDGITLYEAMAALFLAQALGYDLSLPAQLTIVAASLMAGVGVAGIPEAGLIVLPLVLATAGLPEHVVAALLPLIYTVDWILARARTMVNVMSDMLVAIVLDRWARRAAPRMGG